MQSRSLTGPLSALGILFKKKRTKVVSYLEHKWSKRRNIKMLCKRGKKEGEKSFNFWGRKKWNSSQLLVFAIWLLSESLSGFSSGQGAQVVLQLLATLPVSPSPASRGSFSCDQEGETSVSPLGGTVQSSGKIVGAFPLPLHLPSYFLPVYFQKCIVSD